MKLDKRFYSGIGIINRVPFKIRLTVKIPPQGEAFCEERGE